MRHTVHIHYCTRCGWLLRASWISQELLSTFADEIDTLSLCPGDSGIFEIYVNDVRLWSRTEDGGFPDIAELKCRVRDQIAPERALGHTDRAASKE